VCHSLVHRPVRDTLIRPKTPLSGSDRTSISATNLRYADIIAHDNGSDDRRRPHRGKGKARICFRLIQVGGSPHYEALRDIAVTFTARRGRLLNAQSRIQDLMCEPTMGRRGSLSRARQTRCLHMRPFSSCSVPSRLDFAKPIITGIERSGRLARSRILYPPLFLPTMFIMLFIECF